MEGRSPARGGHGPCPSFSKPLQEEGQTRSFLVSPVIFAPGSSPRVSLLLLPPRVSSRRDKTIPSHLPTPAGTCTPSRLDTPPLTAFPWDQRLPETQGDAFPGFLPPEISPVEDASWMAFAWPD